MSSEADSADVGARVAARHRRAGLTQRGLAERAHVSYSLLRKVERGERRASTGTIVGMPGALLALDPSAWVGEVRCGV